MMKDNRSEIDRASKLGFHGLCEHWEEVKASPWVGQLLDWEEQQRSQRSLERRIRSARIGTFKPMADFDYNWPTYIDRDQIDDLFELSWIGQMQNMVLIGPNGIGKTMIAQNVAYQAVLAGHTVLFCSASRMLNDLATQDGPMALERRIGRYSSPGLLCVDEVGYLSYDTRLADLFFEVVSRRYNHRSILVSTNKNFTEWNTIFPNAACAVTMIDRLVHHSEIIKLKGKSYRLKEAMERAAKRAQERAARKNKTATAKSPRTQQKSPACT